MKVMIRGATLIFLCSVNIVQAEVNCQQKEKMFDAAYAANKVIWEEYRRAQCPLDISNSLGFTLYDIAGLTGNKPLMDTLVSSHAAKHGHYSPALIKFVQTGLRYIDHDAGPVDGKLNSTTQSAIKAFQRSIGKKQSGTIDVSWLPTFYKKIIKQVQRDLTRFGYTSGEADGILGPKTQNALRSFRVSNKLEAPNFGQIDYQIIYRLMLADNDRQKVAIEKREAEARAAAIAAEKRRKAAAAERARQREQQARLEREARERAAAIAAQKQEQARQQQQVVFESQPIPLEQTSPIKILPPPENTQPAQTVSLENPGEATPKQQVVFERRTIPLEQTLPIKIQAPTENTQQAEAVALEKQREAAREQERLAEEARREARARELRDQAELEKGLGDLEARYQQEKDKAAQEATRQRTQQQQPRPSSAPVAPAASSSGKTVGSKFTTVSGILLYAADGSSCSINGKKMDASSCQNYKDTGANKHCDAVMSNTGVVVSLRCK